ncbi:LINE-1 retrotransposable element ORF2 protein, partial [Durusdinium trenchii]
MAASADAPPYGLGSPDPLSRGPLPGVAGEVTEATEAGLSTTDRVVGVTVKAMSLREVNPVEASERLNGTLRRRSRIECDNPDVRGTTEANKGEKTRRPRGGLETVAVLAPSVLTQRNRPTVKAPAGSTQGVAIVLDPQMKAAWERARFYTQLSSLVAKGKHPWGRSRPLDDLSRVPRLNVARLQNPDVAQAFNEAVFDLVRDDLASDLSLWQYAVRRAAEHVCGPSIRHRRPLWQVENSAALQKLAVTKQRAFLGLDGSASSVQHYRSVKKACRREVRVILNRWWSDRAAAIQLEVDTKTPNHQFAGFKELRQVFVPGHRPASKLKGSDGSLLRTRAERVTRSLLQCRNSSGAYDSVSREGLWALLLHKGVPLHLVNLIRQYYSGKVARISVEGILSKEIPLHTGTLRKYSTWETLMLHDLGYADDAAFIADTYEQLASWARALQAHYSTWGLSLSVAKTEALTTAAEGGRGPISMDAFWQLTANVWDVAQLVRAPSRVQKRSFTQKTDDLAGALESLLPAQSWLYREASLGGLQKGHDQLAAQLERVAAVAVRASSDAGEARADLQLVFFLQGRIRTKVMETLASYNSERPGILDGSRDKGPPLKCRIYEDLLAATLDQGAGQPTAVQALAALKDYPTGPAAIHSVGNLGKPREVKTHLGLCLYSSLGLARAAASVSCGPILTWAVSSAKVLTAGLIWDASLVGIAPPGPRNRSALTLASASLGRAAAKERPPGFPPRGLLPMPQMPGGREPDGSSAARPIDLPFWCVPVSSGRWGVVLPTTLLVVP